MNAQPKDDLRLRELGAIHVAKKALGLDDDAYRDVLERVGGKRSAKDLAPAGRRAVLDHFRQLGAFPRAATGRRAGGPRRRYLGKLRAQWLSLYWLGVVNSREDAAIDAMVKRTAGIDRVEWLDARGANKVIEGLKAMAAREAGVDWSESDNPRICVMRAQWRRLGELDALRVPKPEALNAWLQWKVCPHKTNVEQLTDEQADAGIERLGRWIRKVMGGTDV